jgi:hypothetical protein
MIPGSNDVIPPASCTKEPLPRIFKQFDILIFKTVQYQAANALLEREKAKKCLYHFRVANHFRQIPFNPKIWSLHRRQSMGAEIISLSSNNRPRHSLENIPFDNS